MTECYICLENIDNDIATLSCGHKYHFGCISEWIKKKNDWRKVCVICTDIETEIVRIENITNKVSVNNDKQENELKSFPSIFLNCCTIL